MFFLSPEPGEDFPEGQVAGRRYYPGRAFCWGEFKYSPKAATGAKFEELGFTAVPVEPRPDSNFYIVHGPDDQGKFSSTPRDLDLLKGTYCAEQVGYAQSRLEKTDFMYARAAEQTAKQANKSSVAVPAGVATNRDEVRSICKENCALIMAVESVQELEELIKAPTQQFKNNEWVPNPEPHLKTLPTIDLSAYLTPELI